MINKKLLATIIIIGQMGGVKQGLIIKIDEQKEPRGPVLVNRLIIFVGWLVRAAEASGEAICVFTDNELITQIWENKECVIGGVIPKEISPKTIPWFVRALRVINKIKS